MIKDEALDALKKHKTFKLFEFHNTYFKGDPQKLKRWLNNKLGYKLIRLRNDLGVINESNARNINFFDTTTKIDYIGK